MFINISYQTGQPIYEQIKSQIRSQIISGELQADMLLPSIRTLAKELQVGIITAKRAYDDLCAEGFLYSVQGKGVYVAKIEKSAVATIALDEIRKKLEEAVRLAEERNVSQEELIKLLKQIWRE